MTQNMDSKLKQLMLQMNQAFRDSSVSVEPISIERMAVLIYQVMSARYRIFHTVDHVFHVAEPMKGTGVFAALMHDLVYFQVDRRIHPLLSQLLHEFQVNEKTYECILPDLTSEKWMAIAGKIFGFQRGQTLNPFSGLNEFLSAVAAARMLSIHLEDSQTIEVIACIESTIPFRSQKDPVNNAVKQLEQRLNELNQSLSLKRPGEWLTQTLQTSITLSNQDVSGFFSKDFGEFLAGTWSLILENNPIFRNPLYSVGDYGKALLKIQGFFLNLDPESVVHEWKGVPPSQEFKKMNQQVKTNLRNALLYLDLKLVEISFLTALANSTGGDAPYFLLIGRSGDDSHAPIEKYFPGNRKRVNASVNEEVFKILKFGRQSTQTFDFNHSPIAAYLYEVLTNDSVENAIRLAREFIDRKIDGKSFIASFPAGVVNPIIQGVSEISWSRGHSIP